MKEEPCLFLFKDCRPAFRFDYRGAAIHQGRLRVESGLQLVIDAPIRTAVRELRTASELRFNLTFGKTQHLNSASSLLGI